MLSLKIAWRNIYRHKGKSLVIGVILFLGAWIMTVGNGIISGLNEGLKENIVNRFTGDIVLISDKQVKKDVLFPMMGESIEVISGYPAIKDVLAQQPYVDKFLPAAQGAAMVLSDAGEPDLYFLLGVDFAQYQKMFDNVETVEGRLLKPGERGLLLTTVNRKMLYDYLTNYWVIPENCKIATANLTPEAKANIQRLQVRDKLVFMGFSDKNTTLDILSPVKGVIKYKSFNKFWGFFNIIDLESFRECFGYVTAADSSAQVDDEKKALLAMDESNLEGSFSMDGLVSEMKTDDSIFDSSSIQKETEKQQIAIDTDKGSFNLVYIKLKPGVPLDVAVKKLNKALNDAHVNVQAITWKQGLGQIADMAMLMKGALFVFVTFIFFVAIIVIMNTLSMAALERIPEIGMMRAVGAKKSFISSMFLYETAMLSFVFGGIGIISGIVTVKILALMNITTANEMLQLFFGGDKFQPLLSMSDIILGIVQLAVVTLIATIYPMIVARRITPLEAIARD